MKCEKCSGTGHIMFEGPVQVSESAIINFSYVKHCPECVGSGKIVETKFKTRRCYKCDGKGKIEVIELEYKTVDIDNVKGYTICEFISLLFEHDIAVAALTVDDKDN